MPLYQVELDGQLVELDSPNDLSPEQLDAEVQNLRGGAAAEQPGYGQSLLSAAGRGFASVVPGVVGGVGYLTGSEGLVQTAEDIEQSIAEALPINPAFEDDFAMKAASTVGQVGSILATGGAAGVAGKALQGVRLAGQAARAVPYATGILQGVRGGGQEAEQYGMEGAAAYGRALAGGAVEGLVERLPFGMLTETAAARRLLGEAVTPAGSAVREIAGGIGTEATEEGLAQIGGNVATMGLAPEGVETPGLLEGVGEAAALGAVGGAAFGGVNALVRGRPQTIESGEAEIPESLRVAAEAGAFPNVDELESLAGPAATEEVAAAVRQAAELSPTPTYEQGLAPSQPEAGVAPVGIEEAAPLENLPVSEPIVPESRELPVVPVEPAAPAPEAPVELEAAVTPTELETLVPAAEPVSAVETPVAPAPLEEALPPIAAEVTQPQPEPTEPNAPEIRQIIEDGQLQYQDTDEGGPQAVSGRGDRLVEGGQVAAEGQEVTETEEQRFQRIKAAPALARTQEDVDWANAYSRRRSPPPTPVEAPTVRAGFLERMTPMQRTKAEAALKTNMVRRNQLQSRREIVEEMVSSGATIQPHPKDKRRLMLPDGSFIEESRLTKTGMDYAEFLLSQAPAVVETEQVAPSLPTQMVRQLTSTTREVVPAGPSFAEFRQRVLETVTGQKVPKAKAGVGAVEAALYAAFGINQNQSKAGKDADLRQALLQQDGLLAVANNTATPEQRPRLTEAERVAEIQQITPTGVVPTESLPAGQPTPGGVGTLRTAQKEFLDSKGISSEKGLSARKIKALEKEYSTWLQERGGAFRLVLSEQRGGGQLVFIDWQQAYQNLPVDLKADLLLAVANNRGRKATAQDIEIAVNLAEELVSQSATRDQVFDEPRLFFDLARNPVASENTRAKAKLLEREALNRFDGSVTAPEAVNLPQSEVTPPSESPLPPASMRTEQMARKRRGKAGVPTESLPAGQPTPGGVGTVAEFISYPETPVPAVFKAVHYSHAPLELKSEGKDANDSTYGFGFYASEPGDESMWVGMQRLVLGPIRNEVTISPKKPLVVTPQRLPEVHRQKAKGESLNQYLSRKLESGEADALIIRGFPDASAIKDLPKQIDKRLYEIWTPVFASPSSSKFTNVEEYEASWRQASEEVTGVSPELLEDFMGLQNQIVVPPQSAPEIVSIEKRDSGSRPNLPQSEVTPPSESPLPPASMRTEQMARKRRGKAGVPQSVRDQDGAAVDVRVTPAEAQRAREIEGKQIPGVSEAWVGTTDEFLAEFGDLPDFNQSTTAVRADGGLEAFYDPKMDRAFILIDRAQAREGDARRAVRYGTSTGIETVRRLLRHEAFAHRGWRALPTNLKTEFINLLPNLITPDDIDSLVAKGYARYANWREDPLIYYMAAEEWLATRIERISKLPRAQQGKWTDFMDWLKRVFQWLTGDDTVEPTPKELTDIMRQMVRALEVREARAPESEPAGLRSSLNDTDVAYLAAVERGDMEEAQRMVDEAAKKAGYDVGPLWHGTRNPSQPVIFDTRRQGQLTGNDIPGTYFTNSRAYSANAAGERFGNGSVNRYFLKLDKMANAEHETNARYLADDQTTKVDRKTEHRGDDGKKYLLHSRSGVEVRARLEKQGFNGVYRPTATADEWIAFEPSQIKSADPVTYDNNGNVIPLSQRFQSESSDIRFSLNDREQRLSEIANSGSGQYQESDALPFTAEAVPGRPVREAEGQDDIARNLNYETTEIAKVREAAMKFVDDLGPMETWFDQLGNPDWQQKVGLRPGSPLGQFVLNEALVRTQAEALVNPAVYTVNRQLADYINATGSVLGGALGTRAAIQRDPRYIAMYATQATLDMTRKQQKTVIDPQVNVPQAVEAVQLADQRAREQATTETAEELDLDQIVLDMGMAALDPELQQDIREINNHVLRIGTLQRLRQRLTSGVSQSLAALSAADLEAQYAGLTVEQIDALLAQEQEALAARVAKVKGAMAGKPKQRVAAADSPVEQARKLIERLEAAPTTRKPKANPVRDLYKKHLTEPMAEVDFVRELGALGVPADEASRLYALAQVKLAAVEVAKQGRQERGVRRRLADLMDPSKGSLLNALNRLRDKVTGDVNWSKIFEAPFERQQQWRVELYRALRADPALANLTPQEARDLAAEVDRIWNLKRQKAFDDQMKRVNLPGVKPEAKKKVQESAPQLLRYINVGTFGDDSFRQAVSKKFGIKALSADEIKRITELAQAAQAEGISTPERSRILDELVKTLQSSRNAEIGEILSNYWVTSVLSGFRTQFDTALAFLNGLRVMSQGVAYSAITKRDFKLAGRAAKDYFKTLADTISEAVAYFVTGDPTLLDGYQYGLQTFFKEGVAASAPYDYFEQVIKSKDARALAKFSAYFMAGVQRAMRAFDHINSVSTTEGWKSLAVTLDQNRYRDARLPTPGDVEAARKKALDIVGSDKGFTNRAKVSAATRQILNDTLNQEFPGLLDEAREIGLISSYQNDPTGIGGIIYHTLLGVTNKAVQAAGKFRDQGAEQRAASEWSEARKLTDKALRGILYGLAVNSRNITGTRFVRFAGNRFNELLSFLPGAGLLRLYEKDMNESKRAMLITNNLVGSMLGVAMMTTVMRMLSDEEDDEKRGFRVEGSWSNLTPDQKNQLRSQGRSPYTLSFYDGDGKWSNFNYNSWPVAGILAAAGTLNDLRQYAPEKWEAKDMLDRVVSAAWAGVTTFKDLSALSGLMDLLGTSAYATGDPVESAKKWAAKFAANFGGGFIPRAVKDVDAMMNPEIRKPDDMAAYFAKEVPFFRRLEVGGQKLFNIFGEPVQINRQPWSRSYTQAELDDEYRTLGELNSRGLFLGAANPTNRTIGSGPTRRELTDREAELYMQTAGKFYKDYIRSQGERLLRLPNEQAKKAISQDTERLRNAALRRAVSEAKKEGT